MLRMTVPPARVLSAAGKKNFCEGKVKKQIQFQNMNAKIEKKKIPITINNNKIELVCDIILYA